MHSTPFFKPKRNPRRNANFLSILTFWWTVKIFKLGIKRDLEECDLFEPLDEHSCGSLGRQIAIEWHREYYIANKKDRQPNVLFMLCRYFINELFFHNNILMCLELFVRLLTPIFLSFLLKYFNQKTTPEDTKTIPGTTFLYRFLYLFSSDQPYINRNEAIFFSCAIIFCIMMTSFIMHPYMIMTMHTGMKMRVACSSLLYRKALRISNDVFSKLASGNVINLISNDMSRLDYFPIFLPYLWICPLQIIIVTYFMYRIVGRSAVIGICVVLIFIPIQIFFGHQTAKLRNMIAKATDDRVNLMNEMLQSIQVIKMYAWETPLSKQINEIRKSEIRVLKYLSLIRGFFMSSIMFVTRLGIYLTFISCVFYNTEITAENLFVVTAYYMILRQTTTVYFPQGIAMIAETLASVKRINEFMIKDESDVGNKYILYSQPLRVITRPSYRPSSMTSMGIKLGITLGEVSVIRENGEYMLRNINLEFKPETLTIIVGAVGSGKTMLLDAILGELPVTTGFVDVHGTVSYSTQEPWLFAGSVRQNILFGEKLDRNRYNDILQYCSLIPDLKNLPYGDRTLIGERGISLSGGQRARISLARAIYKDTDIYVLDDPLSAVDPKVANQLFDDCISGFLKKKCCILVTHQVQFLSSADQIVIMQRGHVVAKGTYLNLTERGVDFMKIVVDQNKISEPIDKGVILTRTRSSIDSVPVDCEEEPKFEEEICTKGSIDKKIYINYFRSSSGKLKLIIIGILFLLSQFLASCTDFWVNYWAYFEENYRNINGTFKSDLDNERNFYIGIYTILVVLLCIISITRSFWFFIICMNSSVKLHNKMFTSIIRSPLLFFNTNPSGRILNRFSKDIGSIDEYLPNALMDCFQIILNLAGALIVVFLSNFYLLIPTLFLLLIIFQLRKIYLKTSRSIKRLEAITRSPIYSHLNASLQGLNTIRVNCVETVLIEEFDKYQDIHSSAWYLFINTSRAFGLWLDLICALYIACVIISFLFLTENSFTGNVGLSITQCIGLTGILQWGIRQSAELENQMTSVERVLEFAHIESEPNLDSTLDKSPPNNWPKEGKIEFKDMSLYYVITKPASLYNLSIVFNPREKIGIVGRTGAGKSSIISALFRLSYIEGKILIDDVDTGTISLHDLRKNLSIIPQEPVLFLGTMRYNLDPFAEYSDEVLIKALRIVNLNDNLDSEILHSGFNLSVGQRQLVCLARAIVRNNKILVLDEATANVDPQTDSLIQNTIRNVFSQCTVLTIAHRLQTIMDCDKILVMDFGRIAEFNHPFVLLQNRGIFTQLVEQTGPKTANSFKIIAAKSYERLKKTTS